MRVYVFKRKNSRYYQMKWEVDGEWRRETTGERTKAKANDVAARKREELIRAGQVAKFGIETFRDRYEDEFLAGKSQPHTGSFNAAMNKLVEIEDPELIGDIDELMIARYSKQMRKEELSEATVNSYLGYLDRALKWAVKVGLLGKAPNIERIPIPDEGAAKGRPLFGEEIDRMKEKAESVVGKDAASGFKTLIDGLNVSGLRLGEALRLSWPTKGHDADLIIVNIKETTVTLSIPASSQKRKRREAHAVTPDFAKFLRAIPKHERVGFVFSLQKKDGSDHYRLDTICKRFSKMGEDAGIIVKTMPNGKVIYASAHDLRRTFGLRWAKKLLKCNSSGGKRHLPKLTATRRKFDGRFLIAPKEFSST